MSDGAFPELADWHRQQAADACYLCSAEAPRGGKHTDDHVVPRWLAPESTVTAAMCRRCQVSTRDLERNFKNEVSIRAGGGSRLWAAYNQNVLKNPHPLSLLERVRELSTFRRIVVDGAPRFARSDAPSLKRGVEKVTRGLFRVLAGKQLAVSDVSVYLLKDVAHFLRVRAQPGRSFRVGDDLDVVVEDLDERHMAPLFRLRFARRFAVVTEVGTKLIPRANGAERRVELGSIVLPDRS